MHLSVSMGQESRHSITGPFSWVLKLLKMSTRAMISFGAGVCSTLTGFWQNSVPMALRLRPQPLESAGRFLIGDPLHNMAVCFKANRGALLLLLFTFRHSFKRII